MKKLKMSILAFAAIASIGSAFALSPKAHRNLNTYYAEQNGSGWTWHTSPPAHQTCKATTLQVSCSVEAASQPADNTMPSGITPTNFVYQP